MLTARHHRALLEVIGEVNGAGDLAEFRVSVVAGARRLVQADRCSYREITRDGSTQVAMIEPEPATEQRATWLRLADQNPLLARIRRTGDGRPYRFSDVVLREALEASELYRELYAPLGLQHEIALALSAGDVTVSLALARGGDDFTQTEREVLSLLRPHLTQAYQWRLVS